jgi:hypothetical protein
VSKNDSPLVAEPPAHLPEQVSAWQEYQFFREELRHEDNLINSRVSWLISSQAFLLGGFATLFSANAPSGSIEFHYLRGFLLAGIPVAGLLGVVVNYVTILGAVFHVRGVRKIAKTVRVPRMPSLNNWHTLQLRMGLFGPLATPLIFLSFWATILAKML